jgi:hypothetical protein
VSGFVDITAVGLHPGWGDWLQAQTDFLFPSPAIPTYPGSVIRSVPNIYGFTGSTSTGPGMRDGYTVIYDTGPTYPDWPPSEDPNPIPPGGTNPANGSGCTLLGAALPGAGTNRTAGDTATVTVTFTGEVNDVRVVPDILHDTEDVVDINTPADIHSPMDVAITFPETGNPASAVDLRCGDGTYSTLSTAGGPLGSTGGGGLPPVSVSRPGITTCFSSAGFGINPADWGPALARAGSCVTQALFIPANVSGQWDALRGTARGTALATAGSAATTILGAPLDFADTAGVSSPCGGPGLDLTMLDSHIPTIYPLNACSGPEKTMADLLKLFLTISVYVGGGILVVNMFLGAFGLQGIGRGANPAPTGGEE